MRGVDSARQPHSKPPGGVAPGGLLIPVISSEFGVDGGGVDQNDGKWVRHVEARCVKHAVRVDDF